MRSVNLDRLSGWMPMLLPLVMIFAIKLVVSFWTGDRSHVIQDRLDRSFFDEIVTRI